MGIKSGSVFNGSSLAGSIYSLTFYSSRIDRSLRFFFSFRTVDNQDIFPRGFLWLLASSFLAEEMSRLLKISGETRRFEMGLSLGVTIAVVSFVESLL